MKERSAPRRPLPFLFASLPSYLCVQISISFALLLERPSPPPLDHDGMISEPSLDSSVFGLARRADFEPISDLFELGVQLAPCLPAQGPALPRLVLGELAGHLIELLARCGQRFEGLEVARMFFVLCIWNVAH